MKCFAPFFFLLTLAASCPADEVAGGILIDRVWAGHPVGLDLLTERGHQFVAYYDSELRLHQIPATLSSTPAKP
jgi:hypothetical protein